MIGTLATQARARGLRRRDRHRRQGLLPARRRRHPRLQPARRRHLVRRGRRRREVRRAARSGRRRAGADGRQHRQHQGRAGHRREGRARADRGARLARRAARGRADASQQKRYREALLAHAESARDEPRAGAHPHGRAGDVRSRRRCGIAARRASACYALFSSLGFRTLVAGVRADGRRRRRATTRVVASLEEVDALAATLRAAGRVRRRADRAATTSAVRARRRRLGVLDRRRDRRGTCRWRTRGLADTPNLPRARGVRAARPGAGRSGRSPRSGTT